MGLNPIWLASLEEKIRTQTGVGVWGHREEKPATGKPVTEASEEIEPAHNLPWDF